MESATGLTFASVNKVMLPEGKAGIWQSIQFSTSVAVGKDVILQKV